MRLGILLRSGFEGRWLVYTGATGAGGGGLFGFCGFTSTGAAASVGEKSKISS